MANTNPTGRTASTIKIRGGISEVKAYALTEDEISTLGVIQGGATLCFTAFGACAGFWINVCQQMAFAGRDTSAVVLAQWGILRNGSFWIGVAAAMIGFALSYYNGRRIHKIKARTTHA